MMNDFYENFDHQQWYGFNWLAIDKATIRGPGEKSLIDHVGAWKAHKETTLCPKSRASKMSDVLNEVTIDTILNSKNNGERELAAFHFLKFQTKVMSLMNIQL